MASRHSSPYDLTLALVVSDPKLMLEYQRRLAAPNLLFYPFSSILEYKTRGEKHHLFAGVIVDMQTAVAASTEEKSYLRDHMSRGQPPFVELGLMESGDPSDPSSLDAASLARWKLFLERVEECEAGNQRVYPRRPCIVKILLYRDKEPVKATRAVTYDLSEGGCFVVSTEDWVGVNRVEIEFVDSGRKIPCRIAWERDWEESFNRLPGIGVQFLDSEPEVRDEIARILAHHSTES